jgi:broad specificity phosphatase PhoE
MARKKVIDILLVESGPTEWDLQDRMGGNADLSLAPGYQSKLHDIQSQLAKGVAVVATGPDEASTLVGKGIADVGSCKHRVVKLLAEVNMGLWQGMTAEELENRYTGAFGQWRDDPRGIVAPEGEQMNDAVERLTTEVVKLATRAKSGECLVLVLRPLAWAIVKLRFSNRPITELWTEYRAGREVEPCHSRMAVLEVTGENLSTYRSAYRSLVARSFF